jgi:ubiquinone/menaquinone biosynthesis C-methylase UbiE
MKRNLRQKFLDFFTFPIRAFVLFHKDRWGLSSLATERFDFVSGEVKGFCLDIGCGYHNRFVKEFLGGNGVGIDIYKYEGLDNDNIVEDMTKLPFDNGTFDTVTFIANINHIPEQYRDAELAEAYRCLKPGGKIIATMGNPIAEVLVHKVVWLSDRFLGTNVDMDSERGMKEEEKYYLTDTEIVERLTRAGFGSVRKKYFWTQWFLNHMLVGQKKG